MASWNEYLPVLSSWVVVIAFGVVFYLVALFADHKRSKQTIYKQSQNSFIPRNPSKWDPTMVWQILESAPVAIAAIDQNGKIKLVNRHLETLFQYQRSELLDQDIEILIPDRYRQAHQGFRLTFTLQASSRHMRNGLPLYGRRKDGSEFPADIGLSTIMTSDGAWVISFLLDISQQKELESVLLSKNEQLRITFEELERRHRELVILGEMGERLQSSNQFTQVFQIIAKYLPRLFPDCSGALYLSNSSDNLLRRSYTWGELPPHEPVVSRDECRRLMQNQLSLHPLGAKQTPCKHFFTQVRTDNSGYLCLPIRSKHKINGLIHMRCENFPVGIEGLLANVADKINLTLSNIELQKDLHDQSIRDSLTGLYNRRHMEASFERELSRATRRNAPVGVIMMDIDFFKDYNDSYGHLIGDEILKLISDFLLNNLRKEDISCRYGGEEFLVILPDTGAEECLQICEKLRNGIQDISIMSNEVEISEISVSMGVAVFPAHGKGIADLIEAADKALYQAKKEGRGRVVLYQPPHLPA